MNLVTPTTQALTDTIVAQIEGSIEQTLPLLPKAFIHVLAKVLAGVFILLFKYAGFSLLQQFVSTASWQETEVNGKKIRPLVEWGRLLGVGDPNDGARAEHTIEITVLNQIGTLAANAQLIDPTTGVIHLTTAPVPLDAPTKTVKVTAYSDPGGGGGVGIIGNLAVGAKLEFARTQANFEQVATVVAIDTVGAAGETEAAYRSRVLRRRQRPPQGGAYADYRNWAEDVDGVANAYIYAGTLPGDVNVHVECTSNLQVDGIASPVLIASVAAAIELDVSALATRRPIGAAVTVVAITRRAFNAEIIGLSPDTAGLRASLATAINQYLRTHEPFIVGLSVPPRADVVTQAGVAGVAHEVVRANGASFQQLRLIRDAQIIMAHPLAHGERAKLADVGGITYTA
jgi:hypothetical protein